MKETDFNEWLASLPALSAAQKQRLAVALTGADSATTVVNELDALGVSRCPHCAAGSPCAFGLPIEFRITGGQIHDSAMMPVLIPRWSEEAYAILRRQGI